MAKITFKGKLTRGGGSLNMYISKVLVDHYELKEGMKFKAEVEFK